MKKKDVLALLESIDVPMDPSEITPGDYLSLVKYFEKYRTRRDGDLIPPYTDAGRLRKAKELKILSEDCWLYAIDAVLFAIDSRYQGFSDGGDIYFKGDLGLYKAKEALLKSRLKK